jgi:hypothetical protein
LCCITFGSSERGENFTDGGDDDNKEEEEDDPEASRKLRSSARIYVREIRMDGL